MVRLKAIGMIPIPIVRDRGTAMGTRMKLLTVGLVLVTAAVAGCSSTTGSSDAQRLAAAATPAATSTAVAEIAGDYMIGDTGPGGGIVFYAVGSVQPWGRFLEAGPELAPADWCNGAELDVAGTKRTIGAGAANTKLIAAACGSGAANTVSDYDGGGKTDWFLPSKDELGEVYKQRDIVGGFGTGSYWSSSQFLSHDAWYQAFTSGYQISYYKDDTRGVRPVRAF